MRKEWIDTQHELRPSHLETKSCNYQFYSFEQSREGEDMHYWYHQLITNAFASFRAISVLQKHVSSLFVPV